MNRRRFLRRVPLLAAGIAGCIGREQPTEGYGDWFDQVSNYDGTVDRTGRDEISVTVGAQGNGGGWAFEPAAVAITSGTRVEWRWTGEGGEHNVVAKDGSFRSEFATRAGYTYSRRFQRQGVYLYYCEPHVSLGMKGAIRVEG